MDGIGLRRLAGTSGLGLALLASGCGHNKTVYQPPATATAPPVYSNPAPEYPAPADVPSTTPPRSTGRIAITPMPEGGVSDEDREFVLSHRPIFSETGAATWYTAPYKGKKAANGEVFRDDALTAAHRTLPMGSLVVVTNLKTGQASAMRISDRGPFVEGQDY